MAIVGIDIGGTKTSVCVGLENGQILQKEKFPTLKNDEKQECFNQIIRIIQSYMEEYTIESIGLSAPGPISVKRGRFLHPPNLPGWHQFPIVEMLENAFNLPIFFNNDANAAALAEYYYGEHKGCTNLIYLTVSTGMGAGIIAEGTLLQGECDMAGEVGHMVLDIHSKRGSGGLLGTFEGYCGGYAFASWVEESLATSGANSVLKQAQKINMHTILEAIRNKDAFAMEHFDVFITRLAQGIGVLIMTLNPKAIVLGTIAFHAKDLLMTPLREKLKKFCWKEPLDSVKITSSTLENIGDLGAIALAYHSKDV